MHNFTFVALSYNHEKYIIEHLESIKFLIHKYGKNIRFEIIIADDASKDNTVLLARKWLAANTSLFSSIIVLSDGVNKGTCKNFTAAVSRITSQHCKITASDDVYSYENLFEAYHDIDSYHLMSGIPLNVVNGTMQTSHFDLFNLIATECVYRSSDYSERLKSISFFNAPNFLHNINLLKNFDIVQFVNQFSVTEDYPFLIKSAEIFKNFNYKLNFKTYVYYRRTQNSTYIIKNHAFTKDKLKIFDYLIATETSVFNKIILKNRKFCFKINNSYLRKIMNISFFIYGLKIIFNFDKIYTIYCKEKTAGLIEHNSHQKHFNCIFNSARQVDFNE